MSRKMTAIEFNNVGKMYRLGRVGTGTLSHDLNRWWTMNVLRKEDPYLKIGETNDRSKKGSSDYVWALRDISFKVEQGDVVGIIGKNGAGKSTLLKLLSRITSPSTGSIRYQGRIASLLEVGTGFHPEMTGRENIYMNGSIMGMTKKEITRKLDEIVDFAGVERYLDTPVKRYSSGMTVRLGFAVAAFLEPEILVVDEVLTVGDAEFQKKAIGKMKDVSQGGGRTVLFVSHNMDSMLNLCDKGVLLENGQIKYTGDIKSTVNMYISHDKMDNIFIQEESKHPVYISSVKFLGSDANTRGIFALNEDISFELVLKRDLLRRIERNTLVGVFIMTQNNTKICYAEELIGECSKEEIILRFKYKSDTLMPNRYYIRVVTHVPNVQFYDCQDTISFTVFDNGTEFLKYNGTSHGMIVYRPEITIV